MKKLTLVNLQCRGYHLAVFVVLDVINGKAVITQRQIAEIWLMNYGFSPQAGETQTVA